MAKISLRMYDREIEGLTEQQRLEEAIAHCRHILKSYPKHLETYRLLGKAYLEAKRYDQAVDLFQRILVATPDDFVSHVGMSIISDDNGKLDDAIWHMERAFEVQPSNAAIQSELQRLFGRRDGVEPPKIRLTRGALAHMYVQGELFNQAISEIRLVLSNDPKRTDMQTLLARAYYRNGQKAEATETCTELLSRFPYCLDANRLMAEILPGTQHPESAQEYRQRVIELDPYAAFVQDSLFRSDTVADGLVTLERLDYSEQTGEMPPVLGIGLEADTDAAGRGARPSSLAASVAAAAAAKDLPVWLAGVADESEAKSPETPPSPPRPSSLAGSVAAAAAAKDLPVWMAGAADESETKSANIPPSPAQNDIPPFLRDAGWAQSSGATGAETAASFAEQPAEELPEGGAVEGDLPDWVKALAPTDENLSLSGASVVPPESAVLPENTPDWISGLSETGSSPTTQETPDWLRGLSDTESSQAAQPQTSAFASETPAPSGDIPDWLRAISPAAPAEEPPAETPDWIKDLAGHELDEPAAPPQAPSESDWLGDLRAGQTATPLEPAEESPGWLKEFDNDLETPIAKAETPRPSTAPAIPELATPPSTPPISAESAANLGSLGTSAQEQDDAMAWLEGLAAKHGAKPEELVTDPNARTELAPEWVDKAKEIAEQGEEPSPAAPSVDETGMWLRGLAAGAVAAGALKGEEKQPEQEMPVESGSSFANEAEIASAAAEPEKEEPPVMAQPEIPPGLEEFAPKPAERPDTEDVPDWLRRPSKEMEELEQQPAAEPRAEADMFAAVAETHAEAATEAAEEGADLPAWLAGLDRAESSMAAPASGAEPSEELPAWLQSEIEPEPEVKEPAKPTDWHPVQPPPAEIPQRATEARTVAEEPTPASLPATRRLVEEPTPAPQREAEPFVQKAPGTIFAPARPKPAPTAKPVQLSISDAQAQLGRGNIAAALDLYGKLIRKGRYLDEIIRDLRDALYRYPVEVPVWQSLGDAYMRANRLQEALDAYTKAEELLR